MEDYCYYCDIDLKDTKEGILYVTDTNGVIVCEDCIKEYFKSEILNAFHTDFQSFKKGNKYVEQFKIIQLYGC